MSFYDLKIKKRDNSLVSLNEYRNKVLLIVK